MCSGATMPSSADWMTSRGAAEIDVERELDALDAPLQEVEQLGDVLLQAHAAARLDEVLPPDAPEVRVVTDEVRELAALVDQVATARARPPGARSRDAPSNWASVAPESLKLSVWSKSDATRKCRGRSVPSDVGLSS